MLSNYRCAEPCINDLKWTDIREYAKRDIDLTNIVFDKFRDDQSLTQVDAKAYNSLRTSIKIVHDGFLCCEENLPETDLKFKFKDMINYNYARLTNAFEKDTKLFKNVFNLFLKDFPSGTTSGALRSLLHFDLILRNFTLAMLVAWRKFLRDIAFRGEVSSENMWSGEFIQTRIDLSYPMSPGICSSLIKLVAQEGFNLITMGNIGVAFQEACDIFTNDLQVPIFQEMLLAPMNEQVCKFDFRSTKRNAPVRYQSKNKYETKPSEILFQGSGRSSFQSPLNVIPGSITNNEKPSKIQKINENQTIESKNELTEDTTFYDVEEEVKTEFVRFKNKIANLKKKVKKGKIQFSVVRRVWERFSGSIRRKLWNTPMVVMFYDKDGVEIKNPDKNIYNLETIDIGIDDEYAEGKMDTEFWCDEVL